MIRIHFIIVLILILVIIFIYDKIHYFANKNKSNELELFCSKDLDDVCLDNFTSPKTLSNSKTILIRKQSVKPTEFVNNGQTELLSNFQCVPNNYPTGKNATDCNIWSNAKAAEKSRTNDGRTWFKTSSFYVDCDKIGKNSPGCDIGYVLSESKTYRELGFSCDVGNGLVPTKVDSEGIISCATDTSGNCLVRTSKEQCESFLNLVPTITDPLVYRTLNSDKNDKNDIKINNQAKILTCSEGKVSQPCIEMYEKLGLKTFKDLGYDVNSHISDSKLIGKKINNSSYNFASYDGTNIIDSGNFGLNFVPKQELKDVVCSEYSTSTDLKYPKACLEAYTYYNLFPSTNPLVIKGNDPNYSIKNTFNTPSDLFSVYAKYQSAFPPKTNSNSSDSIKNGIQSILSETPIKLGCCKRENPNDRTQKNVTVRVPVNPTIESINPNSSKYNFQYSQIVLGGPNGTNSCPSDLYWGSSKCDDFYGLNCDNVINYMKSQGINVEKELLNYAPECACYAPQTKSQSGYPSTTPSICYKNGCDLSSNPSAYIDPSSRNGNEVKTCSLTICNSINDFSGMNIGGNASISPQTQNQCGQTETSETVETIKKPEPSKVPVSNPVSNPVSKPVSNPVSKPIVNPVKTPITNPVSNPITTPSPNPITTPVSNPVIVPIENNDKQVPTTIISVPENSDVIQPVFSDEQTFSELDENINDSDSNSDIIYSDDVQNSIITPQPITNPNTNVNNDSISGIDTNTNTNTGISDNSSQTNSENNYSGIYLIVICITILMILSCSLSSIFSGKSTYNKSPMR